MRGSNQRKRAPWVLFWASLCLPGLGVAPAQQSVPVKAQVLGALEMPESMDRDLIGFWPQHPEILLAQTGDGLAMTSVGHAVHAPKTATKSLVADDGALPEFGKWVNVLGAAPQNAVERRTSAAGYLFGLDRNRLLVADARGKVGVWDIRDQFGGLNEFFQSGTGTKSLVSEALALVAEPAAKALETRSRGRLELRGRGDAGRVVVTGEDGAEISEVYSARKQKIPVYAFQLSATGKMLLIDAGDSEFYLFDVVTKTLIRLPGSDRFPLGISQWKWSAEAAALFGVMHETVEAKDGEDDTAEPLLERSHLVRYSVSDKSLTQIEFGAPSPAKAFRLLAASEETVLVELLVADDSAQDEAMRPKGLLIGIGEETEARPKSLSIDVRAKSFGPPGGDGEMLLFGVGAGL